MKHQHVIEVRDSKAHAYSQVGEFDKLLFNGNPMFFYIYKNNTITDGEQMSIVASRRGFRIKEKLPEISSELEALEASCQHACFVQNPTYMSIESYFADDTFQEALSEYLYLCEGYNDIIKRHITE